MSVTNVTIKMSCSYVHIACHVSVKAEDPQNPEDKAEGLVQRTRNQLNGTEIPDLNSPKLICLGSKFLNFPVF